MSNHSEVPHAKEEEPEDDTTLALADIVTFQACLAQYSFSTQLPIPHLSPRKLRPRRKLDGLLLSDEEELKATTSKGKAKRKDHDSESSPKKKRLKRGYAEPEHYAHLNELPDILAPELDVLFCGINPGQYSATVGHHFASPRNHFWRCLRDSEFTGNELVPACNDHTLPRLFSLGLTNLVHRPTAEQNELSGKELKAGVPSLLSKLAEYRPYVVCIVGLGIAKMVKTHCLPVTKDAESKGATKVGLQPFKLVHLKDSESSVLETLFYAIPSTSGRVVQFQGSRLHDHRNRTYLILVFKQREDKVKLLKELKTKLMDIKAGQLDTSCMHTITVDRLTV